MKTVRIASIVAVLIALSAGCARGADSAPGLELQPGRGTPFELALDLRPGGGAGGTRMVSNGVPLLAGQAMNADELHVVAPNGKEIPAQFRVLTRWWRKDKSIRWVLVSFVRIDSEGDKPIYKLVGRKPGAARPKTNLKVARDDEFIRIDTGAAQFEISRTKFNLLNKVVVGGKTVVSPDPKLGSVVEDPQGRKYYSSKGTGKVRILEQGPVMVKVMAQGWHVSEEEGAFKPGLYGYEITMTFWAGKALCDIDAILTNNSLKEIGEPHFEDWSLLMRIGDGKAVKDRYWQLRRLAPEARKDPPVSVAVGGNIIGGAPIYGALIYQDSVGTEHWKRNLGIQTAGYPKPPLPDLATFRGYKLTYGQIGGKMKDMAQGDFATGVVACEISGLGCTLSPRHFWQQFPSAVQFGSDGVVRMSPFPREYKQVHWLEDATAKGQELQLAFYVGKAKSAEVAAAKEYQTRVFALPSPEHCGAAGALSDIGPYMMHEKIAKPAAKHFSLAGVEQAALGTDHSYGNGFGWQVFGSTWEERAGISGTNYEPMATSNSLWMHLLNGHPGRLEWGMRVARQFRDVRAYHIEGQDNLALWTTFKPGFWQNCVAEHFSRLVDGAVAMTPKDHPGWPKHPYKRHRWVLPNSSHTNLDEAYDLYCLTGDDRALRCMQTVADHAMAWLILRKKGRRRVYRDEGWCLRALSRYYDLTQNPRYKPVLKKCMDRLWRDVNKAGPVSPGGGTWYQAIYARGAINAWLATGDERMRDLALGCADWAMKYEITTKGYPALQKKGYIEMTPAERVGPKGKRGMPATYGNAYHIDFFAWVYSQTGDLKYISAMEFAWKHNHNSWWLGYFPAAMRMAYGPRPYKTAPAAVADLKATVAGGKVTLTWTAPGDDGKTGTASEYQIKYSTKPMLDFVPWPEKKDTHITFWGSTNVADEPAPQAAGAKESYTSKGLKPGKYWFAIKTRDVVNNLSKISNIVAVEVGK